MSALADWQIIELARNGMITPFEKASVSSKTDLLFNKTKIISYGPSSYGYDARLAPEFMLFNPYPGAVVDVKKHDPNCFIKVEADEIILPAHSYMLGRTIETFEVPNDIIVICLGKSSYARAGLMVNVTPLEPGWRGQVTLEIANLTPVPARLYAHEGICQFVFFRGEKHCDLTYNNKNAGGASKYQDQKGIVPGKV